MDDDFKLLIKELVENQNKLIGDSLPDHLDALFTGTHNTIPQPDSFTYDSWVKGMGITKQLLSDIGKYRRLELVFLTGNSYDWVRGSMIERFGLYDIPNVNVVVVSENGLVAQSRDKGIYWIGEPSKDYRDAVTLIERHAHRTFEGLFWIQGNMVRKTFKPTSHYNSFDEVFVPNIISFAKDFNIVPFDIEKEFGDEIGVIYHHPGSSIDIDPRKLKIRIDRYWFDIDFRGKETAVTLLSNFGIYNSVACIARTNSDYPMIKAVSKMKGATYLPTDYMFSHDEFEKIKKEFDIRVIGNTQNILPTILETYHERLKIKAYNERGRGDLKT